MKVKSLSCVQLSATPWTAAYQVPPSMGFSRQEYWSGVPLPSPMTSLIKLKRVYNYNHKQEKKCVSQKRCGSYNEPLPAPLAGEFYSNSPGYTAAPPTPKNPAYTRVAMNTAEAQNWGSEGKSLTFKGTHFCILAV